MLVSAYRLTGLPQEIRYEAWLLVSALMVVGVSLLLWAGWHNLRERRLAMQAADANRVTLTKTFLGRQRRRREARLD